MNGLDNYLTDFVKNEIKTFYNHFHNILKYKINHLENFIYSVYLKSPKKVINHYV
jgi:hypothetical protein